MGKAMKVWDIAGDQPVFVTERDVKLGELQVLGSCPDAPFVICMGGDKPSDNFKETEATTDTLQSMSLQSSEPGAGPVVLPEHPVKPSVKPSGGAASKFSKEKKAEKKAKKKKKF